MTARAESDRERRRVSPLLLGVAALLALLIALVGLAIFAFTQRPPRQAAVAAAAPPSTSAPPEDPSPAPILGDRPSAEAAPAPAEAAEIAPDPAAADSARRPRAPQPIAGVAQVVDTGTLRIGRQTVRLRGVRGEGGRPAEQMASYLGGREVSCEPAVAGLFRCAVDGWDLAQVVLFNGGARATPDAPRDLQCAESKARAQTPRRRPPSTPIRRHLREIPVSAVTAGAPAVVLHSGCRG